MDDNKIESISERQIRIACSYMQTKGYGRCEACSPAPGKAIKVLSMANPRCVACGELVVPPVMDFAATKSDLGCAKNYLKTSGENVPPDCVREALSLQTSSATLGRKFRAASTGPNPQLLRSYYESKTGRMVAAYRYNPDFKESI